MARGLSKERIQMGEAAWAEHIRTMNNDKARRYRRSLHVVSWHRRTKIKLIQYKGGRCEQCGYCKPCPSAFHFHHKDPKEKDFTVADKTCSFERLKREVDKCALLCSNCHAEKHEEEYAEIRKTETLKFSLRKQSAKCEHCDSEFKRKRRTQKYCSDACKIEATTKVKNRPSKEELGSLIATVQSWTALGERFKVTGNTVKKWAKNYGLQLPIYRRKIEAIPCSHCGRMYRPEAKTQKFCSLKCHGLASRKSVRPSMDELVEMRKTQTLMQIGSRYGVNWCTVRDWIKESRASLA